MARVHGNPGTHLGRSLATKLIAFVVPALILILWEANGRAGWVSPLILPPPAIVFETFASLLGGGEIATAFLISIKRIAIGFGLGALLGMLFGTILGLSKSFDAYFGPTLKALAQVPTIGWVPILLLIFGLDETVKYIIIAKASFIPVLIGTADGIRNIPQSQVDAMRVLRLRPLTRLLRFWAPAALPAIVVGLRLGLGSAWIALVIVEMLASAEGVGYLMVWGRMLFQLDILIVGMVLIGISGLVIDQMMVMLERRLNRGRLTYG